MNTYRFFIAPLLISFFGVITDVIFTPLKWLYSLLFQHVPIYFSHIFMMLLRPSYILPSLWLSSIGLAIILLFIVNPVLAESGRTPATNNASSVAPATISTPAITPATAVPLEVTIVITDSPNSELNTQLSKEISISHLTKDEFPAQTDFLFKQADKELLNALRALGYYDPKIRHSLERQAKVTRATFDIALGQPVKTRQIDLQIMGEAQKLPVWSQFRQFQLALRPNTPFRHQDYSATLNALTNLAINEGFMDAKFTKREFKVYPHQQAVDIQIHLDTQKAYQVGEVSFHGSQQINESLLKRFIEFKPGDIFKHSDIRSLQKSLIDSRYFGLIRVVPQYSDQKERRIPVKVELEDNLKHRYDVGLGYGTDTGARVLFGFENRLVNPYGHNYQIDSLLGERAQNLQFNYRLPGERPAVQSWNLGLGLKATQSDTLTRSKGTVNADYHYQVDPIWLINPFVSLETESFRYHNENEENTQVMLFGINVKGRWVNNESYPTSGYRHNASFRISADNLVSDAQFAQIELGSRGLYSLMEFWRLQARLQGVLTAAEKDQMIPASYLSLLGGETLRGYEFESIGLEAEDGSITGARNMIQASIETDYRISEYFGFGVFTDAGQVFDNEITSQLKVGAGLGIRGYTPVGMAKLDVAWPISEKEQPWRIHFSLGFDL